MKALAVTAGIVFWALVLGAAWLAFFPGTDTGESVAVLQIEPPSGTEGGGAMPEASPQPGEGTEPGAAQPPSPSGAMELPPGFAVTNPEAPSQAPAMGPPGATPDTTFEPVTPGQLGTPAPPPAAPDDAAPPPDDGQQGAAPPTEEPPSAAAESGVEQVALQSPAESPASASASAADETGAVQLIAVPVADLVEPSQYGPLPKVAADGRRPADVYARPSRYAAKAGSGEPARVAVLVNGLGLPDSPSGEVLAGLPAPISVAYGAYGRSLQDWVTKARADGHEVLLEIPLEPNDYPNVDPGPHTLLTTLPPEENVKRLQWLMSRYTGYVGVTNHMGAKFEATKDSFQPVLEELKRRGLLYVDDGTVQSSTAPEIAGVLGLDYSVAQVQLDEGKSASDLAKALERLEAMAKERGAAIGVAKAGPETVKQLSEWAGKLESKGIVLVPVSAAVRSLRQS